MSTTTSDELKAKGNTAFASKNYQEAIEYFSQAIEIDSGNQFLWSNKSAALTAAGDFEDALKAADEAIRLAPKWSKAYGRRAAALEGLHLLEEAKEAYESALSFDPDNASFKTSIATLKRQLDPTPANAPPTNPFADPSTMQKLRDDPRTSGHMSDPSFLKMISDLAGNMQSLPQYMGDARFRDAASVILGIDFGAISGGSASQGTRSSAPTANTTGKPSSPSEASANHAQSTASSGKDENSNNLSPEQREALAEKELGNSAYKSKDFDTAIRHYEAAIRLDPSNSATFKTNKSAALFEAGRLEECLAVCKEALDEAREGYASFTLIAKILARMGSVYERVGGEDQKALECYQKSLTEHRTASCLSKLKALERKMEEEAKRAYHNPELAEEARAKGNECFKQGSYADAVPFYSEAIKRDENDPRAYSNRAACYLKLAAPQEGIRDCDKAISLDPGHIKSYIRKAALLHLRKDYKAAIDCLQAGREADRAGKHTQEITSLLQKYYMDSRPSGSTNNNENMSEEERLRRASEDPEVREIMSDPAMREILRQMQADPKAAMEHLRNPVVSGKIQKLMAAGILKMGP